MADAIARPPRERGHVPRICPSLALRGASGSSTFASFVRNPSRARSARHSASTRAGGHADGERDPQWHELKALRLFGLLSQANDRDHAIRDLEVATVPGRERG